jgi:hypothetical protein
VSFNSGAITGAVYDLFQTVANGNSTMDIVLSGNTLTNNQTLSTSGSTFAAATGGVEIDGDYTGSAATVTFNIQNNTIKGSGLDAFLVQKGIFGQNSGGNGSFSGSITNNTVGVSGVLDSGANNDGNGIFLVSTGGGTFRAVVTNNTIQQFSNDGIAAYAEFGSSTMTITLYGNVVRQGDANSFAGIDIENGAMASDTSKLNLVVGTASPSTTGSTNSFAGSAAIFDMELSNFGSSTVFTLYRNGASTTTAVTAPEVIDADNPGNPGVDTSGGAGGFVLAPGTPP